MRRVAVLLAVSLLGGCSLAPPHVRPESPAPPGYSNEYSGDVENGTRAPQLGWRDFFEDPRLEALITAALTQNRDLAVLVARIEEARGLYRIQESDRLPTVGLNGDVGRSRFGAAEGGGTINRFSVGVGVSVFELDFWGRVRNLTEVARSQYLATVEAQRAFQLSLIRDVAAAYLATLEANERIALAEATVQSRQEGLRLARVRLDAGVTSALDFRQAESLLTQAETELAGLRLARARSNNLLAVLIGGPVPEPLPDPLPLARQASTTRLAGAPFGAADRPARHPRRRRAAPRGPGEHRCRARRLLSLDRADRQPRPCLGRARRPGRRGRADLELRPFDHPADLQPRTPARQSDRRRGAREHRDRHL